MSTSEIVFTLSCRWKIILSRLRIYSWTITEIWKTNERHWGCQWIIDSNTFLYKVAWWDDTVVPQRPLLEIFETESSCIGWADERLIAWQTRHLQEGTMLFHRKYFFHNGEVFKSIDFDNDGAVVCSFSICEVGCCQADMTDVNGRVVLDYIIIPYCWDQPYWSILQLMQQTSLLIHARRTSKNPLLKEEFEVKAEHQQYWWIDTLLWTERLCWSSR